MKINKLALVIGITFTAMASAPSHALIISTSVQSSAFVTHSGLPATTDMDGPAASVYSYAESYNSGTGGYTYATGDDTGYSDLFTAASVYDETASVNAGAQILHKAVITNDSASAQNIDFNFLIMGGRIDTFTGFWDGDSNTTNSGFSADIRVNGTSLWNATADISYNSSNVTLTLGGTDLGGTEGWNNYSWGNYNGFLSLGSLAAGASLTLEYQLETYVNLYLSESGYAAARISDPFDFNSNPLFAVDNFITTPVDTGNPTEVPEPAGTLLLGAGLAALAFRRRSRKNAV